MTAQAQTQAPVPADLAARFGREGYLCPLLGIGSERAAEATACVARLEAAGSGRLPYFLRAKPHLLVPLFWDIVHDPAILAPVRAILGEDLLCYGSSFIDKRPGDGQHVAFHQDTTYWGLAEDVAVTAWIALTPSTPDTGSVRVLPGTQGHILAHTDSDDPTNMLGRGEKLASDVDESLAVDLCLAPGEFSLHDGRIIHGSHPNRGAQRRLGFAVRYIPAGLGLREGAKGSATLVSGRAPAAPAQGQGFSLEQRPESEMDPAALRRHRAIFRAGMETIMRPRSEGEPT